MFRIILKVSSRVEVEVEGRLSFWGCVLFFLLFCYFVMCRGRG